MMSQNTIQRHNKNNISTRQKLYKVFYLIRVHSVETLNKKECGSFYTRDLKTPASSGFGGVSVPKCLISLDRLESTHLVPKD
uniref:Uncharacterized protein n=1 Tax=Anguilla anguilla TaxID=7936 RepID=A0A0E9WYN3_ANGAN